MKKFVWFTIIGTALFAVPLLFPAAGLAQFQRPQQVPIQYGDRVLTGIQRDVWERGYFNPPIRSPLQPVVRPPIPRTPARPPVVQPRPPIVQPPVAHPPVRTPPGTQPPIARQPAPPIYTDQPPARPLPGNRHPDLPPPRRELPPGISLPPGDWVACICFGLYLPNEPVCVRCGKQRVPPR